MSQKANKQIEIFLCVVPEAFERPDLSSVKTSDPEQQKQLGVYGHA